MWKPYWDLVAWALTGDQGSYAAGGWPLAPPQGTAAPQRLPQPWPGVWVCTHANSSPQPLVWNILESLSGISWNSSFLWGSFCRELLFFLSFSPSLDDFMHILMGNRNGAFGGVSNSPLPPAFVIFSGASLLCCLKTLSFQ